MKIFSQIAYEKQGPFTEICFNRPEARNCIGPVTHAELIEAWTLFRDDDEALVAVITGTGDKAFCSGGDLKSMRNRTKLTPFEIAAHNRGEHPGALGPSRWTDIYKPIIAAVNGVAYAGGLEWACFADIRIAEEHASFGVTCRRWNIGLADGGTQRLPRIVGFGRAMEMIITGRVIDAQEAYRIGLVSEVVPKGRSLERAIEPGNVIAALPQPAIRTDKEATIEDLGCRSLSDFGLKSNAFTGRLAVRLLTKDCVNLLNGIMQIGRQIEGHAPQDSSVVRESLRLRQMQSSSLWNSRSAN